jgi:cold shock CspA family protein
VSDELDKNALPATDEGEDDVEAHKSAISKTSISADDDDDVEAHKSAISKTSISASEDEKTSIS